VNVLADPVLSVSGLRKEFRLRGAGGVRTLTAVDGVDLEIYPGETVALVGESGSGKSTVARCIARLSEPTGGEVRLAGVDLTALPKKALPRAYRDMQMVFQDPNSSLNPRMTVKQILEEPLRLHFKLDRSTRTERVRQLLWLRRPLRGTVAAICAPAQRRSTPACWDSSGSGRRPQGHPVVDEPTASLDVSVRGQILRLLSRVQKEKRLAYLFISHDLQVVRYFADRVLVMYLGSIVEEVPLPRCLNTLRTRTPKLSSRLPRWLSTDGERRGFCSAARSQALSTSPRAAGWHPGAHLSSLRASWKCRPSSPLARFTGRRALYFRLSKTPTTRTRSLPSHAESVFCPPSQNLNSYKELLCEL